MSHGIEPEPFPGGRASPTPEPAVIMLNTTTTAQQVDGAVQPPQDKSKLVTGGEDCSTKGK